MTPGRNRAVQNPMAFFGSLGLVEEDCNIQTKYMIGTKRQKNQNVLQLLSLHTFKCNLKTHLFISCFCN